MIMDSPPTRHFAYILDTAATAFFAYGHRKNRHPAIHVAAVCIVITQCLLV